MASWLRASWEEIGDAKLLHRGNVDVARTSERHLLGCRREVIIARAALRGRCPMGHGCGCDDGSSRRRRLNTQDECQVQRAQHESARRPFCDRIPKRPRLFLLTEVKGHLARPLTPRSSTAPPSSVAGK